mgnify:FL=1
MATVIAWSDINELKVGMLANGVDLDLYTSYKLPQYELGQVAFGNDGKKYRYVRFLDAVTYAAGQVCCLASASAWNVSNDVSGGSQLAGNIVVGIALGAPSQNDYGWVQIAGIATVHHEGASVAIGDILVADPSNDGAASEADYTAVAHADFKKVGIALAATADEGNGPVLLEIGSAA